MSGTVLITAGCAGGFTSITEKGQLTLSFDMTFLAILLNGLYEPKLHSGKHFCGLHPTKRQKVMCNQLSDYAADMGMLLTYYNLLDDWQDDKKLKSLLLADGIRKPCMEIARRYPRQSRAVRDYIKKLSVCEGRTRISWIVWQASRERCSERFLSSGRMSGLMI